MRHAWLALVIFGGCIQSQAVVCESGRVCPAGTACDDVNGTCVSPSEIAACDGKQQDDACDAQGLPGSCVGGTCIAIVCGNGIVQPGEVCDDGNRTDGDGCRGDCLSDETCGNGVVDYQLGEQCDCGRDAATLAPGCTGPNADGGFCRSDCKLSCGDGMVGPGEVCDGAPPPAQSCLDYGFDRGALGCSAVCSAGLAACGFIGWQRVAVTDHQLFGMWGSSASDIWLVGAGGAIVHYDGNATTDVTSPTTAELRGVWGSSASDVFAVGFDGSGGKILHYDGTTWSPMTVPAVSSIIAVSGTAPNNVWAIGATSILHYDGSAWTTQAVPSGVQVLNGVWAVSSTVAFAAGETTSGGNVAKLIEYSGGSWSVVASTASFFFSAVYATSASNAYVTGQATTPPYTVEVFQYTGSVGSVLAPFGTAGAQYGEQIWGFGDNDVHIMSNGNQHVHWDGQLLTASQPISDAESSTAIWGTSASDMYVLEQELVTNATYLYRFTGDEWSTMSPANNGSIPSELIGTAANDIYWLGGDADVLEHWNGTQWTYVLDLSAMGNDCKDFWLSDANDVFIVGDAQIGHYAPGFSSYVPPHPAHGIWGASAANVFAVGEAGGIYQYTSAWAPMTSPVTTALYDVWGTSASDVFAVGAQGTVIHYNGTAWSTMTAPTTVTLHGVGGTSATDVYAVGDEGVILHYDGASWTAMTSGTLLTLEGVTGTAANDVYAVGDELTILHYDGTQWSPLRSAVPAGGIENWTTISPWPDGVLFGGLDNAVWLRKTP